MNGVPPGWRASVFPEKASGYRSRRQTAVSCPRRSQVCTINIILFSLVWKPITTISFPRSRVPEEGEKTWRRENERARKRENELVFSFSRPFVSSFSRTFVFARGGTVTRKRNGSNGLP